MALQAGYSSAFSTQVVQSLGSATNSATEAGRHSASMPYSETSDYFRYKVWQLLTIGLSQDAEGQLHHAPHLPHPHRLL